MVRLSRGEYWIVRSMQRTENGLVLRAVSSVAGGQVRIIGADYPREHDLITALEQTGPSASVSVEVEGVRGDHQVLGALDPAMARGSGAVLNWVVLEVAPPRLWARSKSV